MDTLLQKAIYRSLCENKFVSFLQEEKLEKFVFHTKIVRNETPFDAVHIPCDQNIPDFKPYTPSHVVHVS